jgi:protocatechuate 3,4-dioxygenase beta subunit
LSREPSRSIELGVQAKGFAPRLQTVGLADPTNIANITLSAGNILRGRVLDEEGNPIAKAHLEVSWSSDRSLGTEWQAQTDANGQFKWDSAPSGPILLDFNAQGYQPQFDVSLVADASYHDITLERTTTP